VKKFINNLKQSSTNKEEKEEGEQKDRTYWKKFLGKIAPSFLFLIKSLSFYVVFLGMDYETSES
jgi:hypothetical protein